MGIDLASPAQTASVALNILCYIAGAWMGSWFPDTDLRIRFLRHRSLATHGFLIPLLLLGFVGATRMERVGWFAAGFCTGVAVHLAFDMFPREWRGYAFVTAPVVGVLSRGMSLIWLLGSIAVCMVIAVQLAPSSMGSVLCIASIVVMLASGVLFHRERAVGPAAVLTAVATVAVWWRVGAEVELLEFIPALPVALVGI